MRSALQAASGNEKLLADRDTEVSELKTKLSELESSQEQSKILEDKIASLESEIASVSDAVPHMNTRLTTSSRQSMPTTPLQSMLRRSSVDSSTSSKNFLRRTQSSRRGPSLFSKRRLCSKRYVTYRTGMGCG